MKAQAVPTLFDMHYVWGVPWEWAYGGLGAHLQPTPGCEAEAPQKTQAGSSFILRPLLSTSFGIAQSAHSLFYCRCWVIAGMSGVRIMETTLRVEVTGLALA